jgi:hypothetical protein
LEISKQNLRQHLKYFTKNHANDESMNKYCKIEVTTSTYEQTIQKEFTIKSNNTLFMNRLITLYNERRRFRHLPIQFIDIQTQRQYPQMKYVPTNRDRNPNMNTHTQHINNLPLSQIDRDAFITKLNEVTLTLHKLQNQINTLPTHDQPQHRVHQHSNAHPDRHNQIVSPNTSPTNTTGPIQSNSNQIATLSAHPVAIHSPSARPTATDDECANQQ